MAVIDTSLVIERISEGKPIVERICIVSVIEHPTVLEYAGFHAEILNPVQAHFELPLEVQKRLRAKGRMKGSSDLIIAAVCINFDEALLTIDNDFEEIRKVSGLKVIWK